MGFYIDFSMNNNAAAAAATSTGGGGSSSSGGGGGGGGNSSVASGSYDGAAILPSTSERTTTSVSSADASSITSSITSSPVSSKKVVVRNPTSTPDIAMNTTAGSGGSGSNNSTTVVVAPQNPFDQIENYNNPPLTPDRSASASITQQQFEAPSSPLNLSTPSLSSAPTTPILESPMRTAPALPLSAPPHMRSGGPPIDPYVDQQQNQPQQQQTEQRNAKATSTTATSATNNTNTARQQQNNPAMYNSAPPQHRRGGGGSGGRTSSHTPMPQQPIFDDDENTEPSSEAPNNSSYPNIPDASLAGSFARFLEHTRIRFGQHDDNNEYPNRQGPALSDDDDDENMQMQQGDTGALICGYLQKLGRNGKWQTRWFETDGECLTYYKSSKRKKPLATLDLEKVCASVFVCVGKEKVFTVGVNCRERERF